MNHNFQAIAGAELSQPEVQQHEIYESTEFPNVEHARTEGSVHSSSTVSVVQDEYYEIQMAEAEVVDMWNVDHTE